MLELSSIEILPVDTLSSETPILCKYVHTHTSYLGSFLTLVSIGRLTPPPHRCFGDIFEIHARSRPPKTEDEQTEVTWQSEKYFFCKEILLTPSPHPATLIHLNSRSKGSPEPE